MAGKQQQVISENNEISSYFFSLICIPYAIRELASSWMVYGEQQVDQQYQCKTQKNCHFWFRMII